MYLYDMFMPELIRHLEPLLMGTIVFTCIRTQVIDADLIE